MKKIATRTEIPAEKRANSFFKNLYSLIKRLGFFYPERLRNLKLLNYLEIKSVGLIFVSLFLICNANGAFAAFPTIKKIVFFGDSLTDDGRLYRTLIDIVPKSPPYFAGRFSNGPTWAEHLGKYYYTKRYIDYKSYALGSSTAVLHLPTCEFIFSSTLEFQIYNYLTETLFADESRTLHAIWIGSNDYVFYQNKDANKITSDVVNKTVWAIKKLIKHGSRNFLILNLPDASITPYGIYHGSVERLHNLVMLNNQKLEIAVNQLRKDYHDVKFELFDTYSILSDFVAHPEYYNKKYNTHVKDTTHACWTGGYISDRFLVPQTIQEDIKQKLIRHPNLAFSASSLLGRNSNGNAALKNPSIMLDMNKIITFVFNSPELKYIYNLGHLFDLGLKPCPDPDNYLFWDVLHPTQDIHRVMAEIIRDKVTQEFIP